MIGTSLLLALTLGGVTPARDVIIVGHREQRPFPGKHLSDEALARMRGGVNLPNGLDVAIGIDIQTRIDGVLVLHTVYNSDGPELGIRVFTDGTDAAPIAPATTTVTTPAHGSAPAVTIDRSPGGTVIVPGQSIPSATVNLVNGGPATWLNGKGQTPVPVVANGPTVVAAPGNVRLQIDPAGAVVILDGPNLEVRQMIGRATGAVVANTGSDRSIATISSINVDLQGLAPQLLAGVFAAQRVAIEAMLAR